MKILTAVIRSVVALLVLIAVPRAAAARQSLPPLTLEELMRLDAGRVFGASERMQPAIEAPASVSFITAKEIARYGYRTLADILRGVRGMYVSDDRNFSLVGVRGFSTPGDYNSRILLLVNGHRVNDTVFGQAEIGAEFGLDPAMFERVEIIRGPASSVYGDSAFFAVVNVITRSGASLDGASIAVEGATFGTVLTRASMGHRFTGGAELAVSGTVGRSAGAPRLHYPDFDRPATNNGIAEGLDGERVNQFYGQLRAGHATFTSAYGAREKDVPTGSFGSLFNEQRTVEQTTDRHVLADVEYARAIGASRVTIRGAFDQFSVDGQYPYPSDAGDGSLLVGHNTVLGSRWSAGVRLTRPLPGRQVLTLGAEFIDNLQQNQRLGYLQFPTPLFDSHRSSLQQAGHLQDEIRITSWLIANAGLRFDRYEDFVKATPRAALIVMPSSSQSFKYLYGRAFRAPNAYERTTFYFGASSENLRPETIDTHEIVWERYTNAGLRTSVSSYWYKADGLITLTPNPESFLGTSYVNAGHVRAAGLELEAQMRLGRGLQGLMSYALQRTTNIDTDTTLVNSPGQMAKLRLSLPGPSAGSFLSLEVQSMSSRRTLGGNTLGAATVANLTLIAPIDRRFEFVGSVRNLLDAEYSDPASDSHRQDDIPQNGRMLRVGLRWKLGAEK